METIADSKISKTNDHHPLARSLLVTPEHLKSAHGTDKLQTFLKFNFQIGT
jgi:hypothetical protein